MKVRLVAVYTPRIRAIEIYWGGGVLRKFWIRF